MGVLDRIFGSLGIDGPFRYGEYQELGIKRGPTHKDYKNKNANVEYYTDEKGNIRRRKVGK